MNNYVISFGLTSIQHEAVERWRKRINKRKYGHKHDPLCGAIGGPLCYSFTPTSVGIIKEVKLSYCGEVLDLIDYDNW